MILDYTYNKYKKNLSVSYITDEGGKKILNFNVDRFKSYYSTPTGKFLNWDGSRCDIRYVDKPHKFDIRTYLKEMPDAYKKLLRGKTQPKLYTFDIETMIRKDENGVDLFPEPSEAQDEITVISVVSSDLNCIVLGWRDLEANGAEELQAQFEEYLSNIPFYKELDIKKPYIKYLKFDNEHDMLQYFLKNIVAKVPVIAGWNSILFDWQYIQNRIRGYFPDISINSSSYIYTTHQKQYTDQKQETINLTMPDHTLVLDMMDIIGNYDMVVMPIKESMSLDFVSHETLGANKIKYQGTLQDLYEKDYNKYVFYNAIDSILVQLLDKKFKTLGSLELQALQCGEKIGSSFSKISISEAFMFDHFYDNGVKVVPMDVNNRERGVLIGAYVKIPIPGKHGFCVCNDFASLYPNTMRTCNISFENYVGAFWDEEKLAPYKNNLAKYMVVGPNVHLNEGTLAKPKLGRCIATFVDEEKLRPYRNDKNYFVSVNGCVYKNDKDYALKSVETFLYNERNKSKYLSKALDAKVMSDVDHIIKGVPNLTDTVYDSNIVDCLKEMGYDVHGTSDLKNIPDLLEFKKKLSEEILYHVGYEQGTKLNMNSIYGGTSHVAFAWFNMNLANDITGEARNIIHMMEHHIPDFWRENWIKMTDVHKMLGIEVDVQKAKSVLANAYVVSEQEDPDAYHKQSFVIPVYGDTDSNYLCYNDLLKTIKGIETMSIEQKAHIIVDLNLKFMDGHNKEFMENYFKSRHAQSYHKFEMETLNLSGCWLDVKKRYAQIILWKDGKYYDIDNLPLKVKGLEMTKASYPRKSREILKKITRFYLEEQDDTYMLQKLNIEMQRLKPEFLSAPIEDICENKNINGYTKYIIDDTQASGLVVAPKCPANVQAAGNYNRFRNVYKLPGEPIYGGKCKVYMYYPKGKLNKSEPSYFAFRSMEYPEWAETYAPVCREKMFEQYVIDPFNRIIKSNGIGTLRSDGSIQMDLFNF